MTRPFSPIDEVILVDLKNVAYRLHYANMGLTTKDGRPTSVLHGVLTSILSLAKKHPKAAMVFCVDSKTNWRKDFVESYKANRKYDEAAEKVNLQVPILEKVLMDLEFKVVKVRGFEADDLIGIMATDLAQHFRGLNRVMIYSNDKDFFQLDLGRIQIIRPVRNGKVERIKTPMDVYDRFGVPSRAWTKFRALSGDTSDNILHVAGIGPKTAIKLLEDGINPSLKDFDDHPKKARRTHSRLKESWKLIHTAYLLSRIPIRMKASEFPCPVSITDLREGLKEAIQIPYREFRSDIEEMSDKYISFLSRYELVYLLSRRHEIWRIK